MIRVVPPGSRIRMLTFSLPGFRVQGSKKAPNPESRIRNPAVDYVVPKFQGTFIPYFNQKEQEDREPTRYTHVGHGETELLQVGTVGLDHADEAVFEAPQLLSGIYKYSIGSKSSFFECNCGFDLIDTKFVFIDTNQGWGSVSLSP